MKCDELLAYFNSPIYNPTINSPDEETGKRSVTNSPILSLSHPNPAVWGLSGLTGFVALSAVVYCILYILAVYVYDYSFCVLFFLLFSEGLSEVIAAVITEAKEHSSNYRQADAADDIQRYR
jgi:hypothetical protein